MFSHYERAKITPPAARCSLSNCSFTVLCFQGKSVIKILSIAIRYNGFPYPCVGFCRTERRGERRTEYFVSALKRSVRNLACIVREHFTDHWPWIAFVLRNCFLKVLADTWLKCNIWRLSKRVQEKQNKSVAAERDQTKLSLIRLLYYWNINVYITRPAFPLILTFIIYTVYLALKKGALP